MATQLHNASSANDTVTCYIIKQTLSCLTFCWATSGNNGVQEFAYYSCTPNDGCMHPHCSPAYAIRLCSVSSCWTRASGTMSLISRSYTKYDFKFIFNFIP